MKTEKQVQNKFVDNVTSCSQLEKNEMNVEYENQNRGQLEFHIN